MASEFTITPAIRKRLVLSETDLNKSSIQMHDRDKRSAQAEAGRLHYLGHTFVSILFGSWSDQWTLQGMYCCDFTFEKSRHKRNPAKDRQVYQSAKHSDFVYCSALRNYKSTSLTAGLEQLDYVPTFFWGEIAEKRLSCVPSFPDNSYTQPKFSTSGHSFILHRVCPSVNLTLTHC
jgi:hypothetical protein